MNFLAHIYLSGNDELITIGNFIADSIRGKQYLAYPEKVQTGILLHRQIDSFTDTHATFKKSTKRLHNNYGHYSGIIVDILYDHFLAKNWNNYSDTELEVFVANFYNLLHQNFEILPERVQKMIPYMLADNWLVSYASKEGIARVLEGMNHRTKNKSGMNNAINELNIFYNEFEEEFTSFFKELTAFSKEKLTQLS